MPGEGALNRAQLLDVVAGLLRLLTAWAFTADGCVVGAGDGQVAATLRQRHD